MNEDWLKIKECFTAMAGASDFPPRFEMTRKQMSIAAARYMKPRSDATAIRKLSERIMFICFGE